MECNYIDLLRVVFRALLSLLTLFLVTKLIGKKQASELSLFDYVIGISIGNFAAEMTINLDSHFLHGTVAVVVFGLVATIISYATMKSISLRRFFTGTPTLIIENGVMLEGNMRKAKCDINDLLEQARSNGYFNLEDVNYAIMEANGSISFLSKKNLLPPTAKDMNLKLTEMSLPRNVIIDGKFMDGNMSLTEREIVNTLLNKKKCNVKDILLATINDKKDVKLFYSNSKSKQSKLE